MDFFYESAVMNYSAYFEVNEKGESMKISLVWAFK